MRDAQRQDQGVSAEIDWVGLMPCLVACRLRVGRGFDSSPGQTMGPGVK